MKAVYFERFDGTLSFRDVPEPREPTGSEVLVRVHAAGVNRADLLQERGAYSPPPGYSPNIPGLEFAGTVETVGPDAQIQPGSRVMGITAGEAQAEFVLVDGSVLLNIPERLSFEDAAAIPETFITAHDAIFTQCGLRAGETLLIQAVASGVGLAAFQMAGSRGAFIIGTSRSADKIDRCREMGLDAGIVVGADVAFAKEVSALTDGRGADVILDLVGASYFPEDLKALAFRGRMILVGLTGGSQAEFDLKIALYKRAKIIGTVLRSRPVEEKAAASHAFASDFLDEIANGSINSGLERAFPAGDAAEAYEHLASNKSFGKVVLAF